MNKPTHDVMMTSVVMDENTVFTLMEIRERLQLDDDLIAAMREHGLLELTDHVSHQAFQRVQTAVCLYRDLGVNIAGAALVLDMMEQLKAAERELAVLRRHLL